MKKQSRILTKGSKTAATTQLKTAQSRARSHPDRGGLTAVIQHPDGSEWTRVEFSPSERHRIEAYLKAIGLTLPDLIEKAVSHRLAAGTVTCVWTRPDGTEWARVDFERELFSRIEHAASKLGITLQQFFDNAIRHFIGSRDKRRAA